METIAVFINDAAHAARVMQALRGPDTVPVRWLLVACPARLPRHAARRVDGDALHRWRAERAASLFAGLDALLPPAAGEAVERQVATGSVSAWADGLRAVHPALRLVDARRPALGRVDEPIVDGASTPPARARWAEALAASAGLSAMLVLAD